MKKGNLSDFNSLMLCDRLEFLSVVNILKGKLSMDCKVSCFCLVSGPSSSSVNSFTEFEFYHENEKEDLFFILNW